MLDLPPVLSFFSLQQATGLFASAPDLPGEMRDLDGVPDPDGGEAGVGDLRKLPELAGAAEGPRGEREGGRNCWGPIFRIWILTFSKSIQIQTMPGMTMARGSLQ